MVFTFTQPKQISQWVDFESGDIKAKIKIRGDKHKPYVIAYDRILQCSVQLDIKLMMFRG